MEGALMAKSIGQVDPLQGIEYTVYTYGQAGVDDKKSAKWEKHNTKTEMAAAIAEAEKLYKSGKYKKVEVKQKYFDKKKNRNLDTTLKVYEHGKKREINIVMILLFAIVCGAIAFGVTYVLSK